MVRIVGSSQLRKRRRYRLQTTVHEEALAVSGELQLPETDVDSLIAMLEAALAELSEWVLKHEGIIGHIKGLVQSACKTLLISTTGDAVNWRILETTADDSEENTISLTAIVFGIDQLDLEEQLLTAFEKLEKEEQIAVKNEAIAIDYVDKAGMVYTMTILKHFDFGNKRFVLASEKTNADHAHHHHDEGVCNCHEHHESLQDQPLYVFEWLSEVPGGKLIPVDDETLAALKPILDAR
jgi:hypothetical protein